MVRRGIRLVYGGGSVGLMGIVADAVLKAGGEVTGVIPEALVRREVEHHGVTELHVTRSMHERKALMSELADGFIALPGGIGTLEEIFEVWTWAQLGIHRKPCGLLNVDGYFDSLTRFLGHTVSEGFLSTSQRSVLLVEDSPEALLDRFASYTPPDAPKWMEVDQT